MRWWERFLRGFVEAAYPPTAEEIEERREIAFAKMQQLMRQYKQQAEMVRAQERAIHESTPMLGSVDAGTDTSGRDTP